MTLIWSCNTARRRHLKESATWVLETRVSGWRIKIPEGLSMMQVSFTNVPITLTVSPFSTGVVIQSLRRWRIQDTFDFSS